MNSTDCVIKANPDVSGAGIRISIYTLCLGGSIVSYLLRVFTPGKDQEEFSRGVSSALGMQGLAILCTAIYQTVRGDLSLFHAICVIHLLAVLGMDLISKGRYAGLGPWRLYFFAAMQVLALAAFLAFNVYVWITAPHFGNQPECNVNTVYVVFGISIKATSPVFRYIILGTLGAIVASYVIAFTCMLPCLCGLIAHRRRNPGSGNRIEGHKRGWNWFLKVNRPDYRVTDEDETPQRLHGQTLLRFTLNKAAYCGFCIYLIVSLEQTIQRNDLDPEEKGWTFGQVIAIFLLLGVANELLNVLLASWDRKQSANANPQQLVQYVSGTG
ncbi:hypothetical protein N7499_008390 [Penicillium canescens]|uniref:Uncharacterized protein n=1 Tax=Penicillium canescens TaxID=5083 RepID=A0AAD6I004_PENCN|nr:uncharacterized protein N7446_013426 [Penicillium canescens]KAJ5985331.1 hypothetical protein N7522_012527 [Penicillium canescens]KAJ6023072.1 hypothetical protein N7460_013467 [Penicillium canescens]KAJ6025663.1 hypothetical protein N7444_013342 [Penicillium canescens]KAJ6042360.1 hypothetical protein N7446_013426 [Penicillium canescens]KAJ6076409.1 hypothetical protein N7499_008390 [Penicillium canescens]